MNIFIVDLVNQTGQLAKVSEAVAQKGINIEAFAGVSVGGGGGVAILTNDEAGTRRALADAGFRAREIEVVAAPISHKPGSLAAAARKLADAGINIEAALPIGMEGGTVSVAFATDQPAKTRELIGSKSPTGIGVG